MMGMRCMSCDRETTGKSRCVCGEELGRCTDCGKKFIIFHGFGGGHSCAAGTGGFLDGPTRQPQIGG